MKKSFNASNPAVMIGFAVVIVVTFLLTNYNINQNNKVKIPQMTHKFEFKELDMVLPKVRLK